MEIDRAINSFGKINTYNKLCVSLSGGVDSMVLLHALKEYQVRTKGYKTVKSFDITAVHINYNNRDTCADEVTFVEDYCTRLQVPLRIRHITDVTRKRDNTRGEYEEYTRQIRFDTYTLEQCPVILGHNYEDTVENIIANIASKKKLGNLRGMTDAVTERGVTILRPFLQISKNKIYEYSRTHNIPHLPDSTPSWSRRGKLRDHIIPALDRYEPNFIKGLEYFIDASQFEN